MFVYLFLFFCFFFQAEDGIRDIGVTGVQTCALPIFIIICRGIMKIAEVRSRIEDNETFIRSLSLLGFQLTDKVKYYNS